MSWKGFKKAVSRLPQQILSKAGYAEETHDDEFERMELMFKEFEQSVKQLTDDTRALKLHVKSIMDHQKNYAVALHQYYELDQTGQESPVMPGLQAYVAATNSWIDQMNPWLEAYVQRVIVAASEGFLTVIKGVRETVNKRNRKLIDHDRWLTNVKKAQEANEKSNGMKIAEVTKAESQFEMARQEYETINTKIKEEMPQLMAMRSTFVDPILQTLVMFAVEFFTTGGNALQEPLRLLGDVEDVEGTFREDIKAPIAAITELRIVNPKLIDANCEARDPAVAMRPPNMGGGMSTNAVSKSSPSLASESTLDTPPPAYTAPAAGSAGSPKVATAAATAAPPPAAPKPGAAAAPKLRKAIALYDYVSETEGDLNFSKDDVIEIVNMTESQEDWWTGRKDGREGFFPANYVELM